MSDIRTPGARAFAERLLPLGLFLAAAGAAFVLALNTVNVILFDSRYVEFNASGEHNPPTWASVVTTFTVAFVCLLTSIWRRHDFRLFAGAAVLCAFLSLDDSVEIHERLGDGLGHALDLPSFLSTRTWMLLYFPVLAAAAVLLWRLGQRVPEHIRRYHHAGLVLLVLAILLEGAGIPTGYLQENGTEVPHGLRAGFEEAAELAGWILIAVSLTAALFWQIGGDDEPPAQ